MTIKEFAKEQGISTQAVYQRLKKNKIHVEAVTEKGTGEITGEGQTILERLFDPENRQTKLIKDEQIEAMGEKIADLRAELARKDELIANLKREAEKLEEDKAYFKQALDKAQNNLTEIKALLPGPGSQTATGGDPERLTWRERITGRRNR